ncbi:MAG: immunoglobulin domain-containing protein [Verrucomicrobia bacterium]|nr:immunoglobulin domain-containing protein [Verrucomicrobiota bacterium]
MGWQHIQLPRGWSVAEALERYRRHPDVLEAEPNLLLGVHAMSTVTVSNVIPNDPLYATNGQQWVLERIGAPAAWGVTTGSSNVVVAVIDSGIDHGHEDLAANLWRNEGEIPGNGRDDDANGYVDDVHGIDVVSHDGDPMEGYYGVFTHGSICAGILGAVGDNGLGVTGVNWTVQLMAIRLLANASSNFVDTAGFVEACCYVLDMKARGVNVRVTSNSYGFTREPPKVVRCALECLGDAGILNVFAAGTKIADGARFGVDLDTDPVAFPQYWHLPGTVNVAAVDADDDLTSDSNWGAATVDLAAPVGNVVMIQGRNPLYPYYLTSGGVSVGGTSLACPYVAGAAALVAAAHPLANAGQIRTALLLTVEPVAGLSRKIASGGRLHVARAIEHPGLLADAGPCIAVQPRSQVLGLGDTAVFAATATGPSSSPLTFQWQRDGGDLGSATNATLVLSAVGAHDAGEYRLVVSNAFGTAISDAATLTVAVGPMILEQPQGVRVAEGGEARLAVGAVGAAPLRYQWQHQGANIADATQALLVLSPLRPDDAGGYRVIIANDRASVTSTVAEVTVVGLPWIVAQPQSLTVTQGASPTLSVTVANTAMLPIEAYWFLDGNYLGGTVHDTFTVTTNVPHLQTNLAGAWQVMLANEANAAGSPLIQSEPAHLTVVVPPADQVVAAGTNVAFGVEAYGTAPITYQWLFQGTNLPGATNAVLTLTNAQPSDGGVYGVIVRNAAGEPAGFFARLDVAVWCGKFLVRRVECMDSPLGWCVRICWPDRGDFVPRWSGYDSNGVPANGMTGVWDLWPGPIEQVDGCKCLHVPVLPETMAFFGIR